MKYRVNILILIFITCIYPYCLGADTGFDGLYKKYRDRPMSDLKDLGAELLSRDSRDSALVIYTIISNRYERDKKAQDEVYAVEAHNSLGVLSFLSSNYADAYSHFMTAVELDGRPDAAGNLNLSAIYLYYGDRKRAYELLRRVFNEAVNKGHYYWASAALINILTSGIDDSLAPPDSLAAMIRLYNRAVPNAPDNPGWAFAAHLSRARLMEINGNYSDAIREYRKSLKNTSKMLIPPRNEYASYVGMAEIFNKCGIPDSALYYMKKAESLARRNGYTELLINSYTHLSNIYEKLGDDTLAEKYRYKKLELSDSAFNIREFGKIRDLEMFHEADKFEKRINMLQMEEKIRTRTLWLVSTGLVLFISLCIYIFAQNRSLRRKNRILYESNMAAMRAEEESANKSVEGKGGSMFEAESIDKFEPTSVNESAIVRNGGSLLDKERGDNLEYKIRNIMADETQFCREGFSLKDLADLCGSNSKYVSQVLNDRMHTTFTQLLSERRISIARKRFVDWEHYGHLTIEGIALDLGFRSRSNFSRTFKSVTGLSPSEFQRMVREDGEHDADSETKKRLSD